MSEALIIDHVSKSFNGRLVVDDVSLSLPRNRVLAIVGESGCGKTTLAKIIAGLTTADKGQVRTESAVQMVFQDPNSSLDPLYTIMHTLEEAFYRLKHLSKEERRAKINEIMQAVGLDQGMLVRYPHEFSGGQRQRIAIARVLLTDAKIIVLDEITSSLDVLVQAQIMSLLKSLQGQYGLSYIFISHNLRVVKSFADTIALMHQGRVIRYE